MGYKSIVCGVTGSAHAQKAALEAARLARAENANLTYVYAVDMTFLKGGKAATHSTEESLESLGRHILENAAQVAWDEKVTAKKMLMKGRVHEVLKKAILENEADLLVLGHEERTFFEKFLLEGTAEDYIESLKRETGVDVSVVE